MAYYEDTPDTENTAPTDASDSQPPAPPTNSVSPSALYSLPYIPPPPMNEGNNPFAQQGLGMGTVGNALGGITTGALGLLGGILGATHGNDLVPFGGAYNEGLWSPMHLDTEKYAAKPMDLAYKLALHHQKEQQQKQLKAQKAIHDVLNVKAEALHERHPKMVEKYMGDLNKLVQEGLSDPQLSNFWERGRIPVTAHEQEYAKRLNELTYDFKKKQGVESQSLKEHPKNAAAVDSGKRFWKPEYIEYMKNVEKYPLGTSAPIATGLIVDEQKDIVSPVRQNLQASGIKTSDVNGDYFTDTGEKGVEPQRIRQAAEPQVFNGYFERVGNQLSLTSEGHRAELALKKHNEEVDRILKGFQDSDPNYTIDSPRVQKALKEAGLMQELASTGEIANGTYKKSERVRKYTPDEEGMLAYGVDKTTNNLYHIEKEKKERYNPANQQKLNYWQREAHFQAKRADKKKEEISMIEQPQTTGDVSHADVSKMAAPFKTFFGEETGNKIADYFHNSQYAQNTYGTYLPADDQSAKNLASLKMQVPEGSWYIDPDTGKRIPLSGTEAQAAKPIVFGSSIHATRKGVPLEEADILKYVNAKDASKHQLNVYATGFLPNTSGAESEKKRLESAGATGVTYKVNPKNNAIEFSWTEQPTAEEEAVASQTGQDVFPKKKTRTLQPIVVNMPVNSDVLAKKVTGNQWKTAKRNLTPEDIKNKNENLTPQSETPTGFVPRKKDGGKVEEVQFSFK